MINLLLGHKGSGKTKKLIDLTHEAVEASKGNVVCIEKGDTLTYGLDYNARLVNIEDYNIKGFDAFYGFLCGLCAGNYDITDVLVDSTLKIGGDDKAALGEFAAKLNALSESANVKFTLSVSADKDELPEGIEEVTAVL